MVRTFLKNSEIMHWYSHLMSLGELLGVPLGIGVAADAHRAQVIEHLPSSSLHAIHLFLKVFSLFLQVLKRV